MQNSKKTNLENKHTPAGVHVSIPMLGMSQT